MENINSITHFISFATIRNGYIMPNAHQRWSRQISHLKQVGLVKNGKIYSEYDLDKIWTDRFGKYTSDKGYAYWSWKPYLIHQVLNKMAYGETLCYFDGGCVLPEENSKLEDLTKQIVLRLNQIEKQGYDIGLTMCGNPGDIPCRRVVRKQIIDKMGLTGNEDFSSKFPHWQATLMLFRKTWRIEKLVRDWVRFFFANYESAIHSPYRDKGQCSDFLWNVGDQAVLQCLLFRDKYRILNVNPTLISIIKRQRN